MDNCRGQPYQLRCLAVGGTRAATAITLVRQTPGCLEAPVTLESISLMALIKANQPPRLKKQGRLIANCGLLARLFAYRATCSI